jgi:hypothetical protein
MATGDTGLGDMISAAETTVTPSTDTTTTETPSTSTTNTNDSELSVIDASTETTEDSAEGAGKETELKNADGSEKTPERQEDFRAKAAGKEPLPAEVRVALKALKDADPKNAAAVKALHGAYERYTAIKDALGAEGPNGLKSFLSEVGAKNIGEARATLARTQEVIDTVSATDQLLYVADPTLSTNVFEDMKSQGVEDQYPKVVGNFLDHLKEADAAGYYETTKPHMVAGLNEAGLPSAINSIYAALSTGDTEKAKETLKMVANWFTGLRDEVGDKAKVEKALSEREQKIVARETEGVKAERTKVETGIAENCEKSNNTILGKSLGGFLRMPFFKDFPHDTKVDLGNGIKDNLYAALKADKSYQQSMKTLWGAKIPNRAQMVQVHEDWLRTHGDQIVRDTVTKRYPGYAKGGSAAGKAAAAVTKKADASKAATQSIATMRPIYVASRPENLVRDSVRVGGKEYNGDQLQVLQIQGKGFVRTTDGKGLKFVSWRKS